MNKELKKAVEAELTSILTAALSVRNRAAAAGISKNIKEGAKSLAKKFVKHLPEAVPSKTAKPAKKVKKADKAVAAKKAKKAIAKPAKAVKKAKNKIVIIMQMQTILMHLISLKITSISLQASILFNIYIYTLSSKVFQQKRQEKVNLNITRSTKTLKKS